jgi:cytoskeletal protein CcmA (bactofilin family)
LPYTLDPGYQLVVDVNTVNTINDCITYPGYSDPVISSVDYYFATDTNVNWQIANVLEDGFGMVTASGAALHIENCTIPDGVIHGGGDVHINNCTVYADVYSDGDMHLNNQSIYGDIYCRGDLEINNAQVYGNVYCDGSVSFNNAYMKGAIFCDGDIGAHNGTLEGSLFATGTITVRQLGVNGGIVYAHTKLYAGDMSSTGVFFSGGDIELTHSMSLNGAMIAKGDIFFSTDSNKYLTINYARSLIEDIMSNEGSAPMFSGPGGEPELNENVFISEHIAAVGRQS